MEKIKKAKGILLLLVLACISSAAIAQETDRMGKRRHFSPEEFQARQQAYITEKADLSQKEADAFFPLYFEMQKKKFDLERNVRKGIKRGSKERMSEEQCAEFVNSMADVKIEVAKLEKEYTAKYLKVIPACKLLDIQRAEMSFQRDLMKNMIQRHENRDRNNNSKKR